MKKYNVTLTGEERDALSVIIKKGNASGRKRIHAQILLRVDDGAGQHGWKDEDVAEAYSVGLRTVERIRERFVTQGYTAALQSKANQKNRAHKFDGKKEAKLIALACSKAPEGRARWTLQLLADRMVELKYMESISHQAVHNVLKKTKLSRGYAKNGA